MISLSALIGFSLFFTALGVGIVASYLSVQRSRGPKERAFVLRISLSCWALIVLLLTTAYFLRPPWLYLVMAIYFIGCPLLVYRWSTQHQLIRMVEEREHDSNP